MFKELTYAKRQQFRSWANDHFVAGGDINPTWHPVVRERCEEINELGAKTVTALPGLVVPEV